MLSPVSTWMGDRPVVSSTPGKGLSTLSILLISKIRPEIKVTVANMVVHRSGRGCVGAPARKSNNPNSHFEPILASALTCFLFLLKKSSLLNEKNLFSSIFFKKKQVILYIFQVISIVQLLIIAFHSFDKYEYVAQRDRLKRNTLGGVNSWSSSIILKCFNRNNSVAVIIN